jgi:LysM repeat protein
VNRKVLARYVAPAAFLIAVIGVVLLVRSSLRSDSPATPTTPAVVTTRVAPAPGRRPARPPAPKQYYVIQSGDTLDAIAIRYATSVERLLSINPGVQANALIPGEQVRVK